MATRTNLFHWLSYLSLVVPFLKVGLPQAIDQLGPVKVVDVLQIFLFLGLLFLNRFGFLRGFFLVCLGIGLFLAICWLLLLLLLFLSSKSLLLLNP